MSARPHKTVQTAAHEGSLTQYNNRATRAEALKRARALEDYGARDRISLVAAKALGAGLVGTPDDIIERLCVLNEIGVATPMIHFYPMLEGLETFATELMPRLPQR